MSGILTFVKPWIIHKGEDILERFDRVGEREKTVLVETVPLEVIAEHYAVHREKPFFDAMIKDMAGKPLLLALYEGEQWLFSSVKEAVRQEFDPLFDPHPGYERNAVHVSANPLEYLWERDVWAPYLYG